MKVKDAMHKGVDWVSPDTPVTELAKLMRDHDVGAIPIGENDRLVGMVTDRDIVCKGLAQDDFDVGGATARDARKILARRRFERSPSKGLKSRCRAQRRHEAVIRWAEHDRVARPEKMHPLSRRHSAAHA